MKTFILSDSKVEKLRSRSGCGAYIWLFFSEAIPAVLARKLGRHILTETMEHNPDIGLDSYDRFFPNQDTLPQEDLVILLFCHCTVCW